MQDGILHQGQSSPLVTTVLTHILITQGTMKNLGTGHIFPGQMRIIPMQDGDLEIPFTHACLNALILRMAMVQSLSNTGFFFLTTIGKITMKEIGKQSMLW